TCSSGQVCRAPISSSDWVSIDYSSIVLQMGLPFWDSPIYILPFVYEPTNVPTRSLNIPARTSADVLSSRK
ncbi:MAG: hypothetical protein KAJ55_04250, partial [Anaerolineales bacterium]|nr:hypothetical protein [Anaerolineales bacterium]